MNGKGTWTSDSWQVCLCKLHSHPLYNRTLWSLFHSVHWRPEVHPEVAWRPPQNSLQLFISGSFFPVLSLWALIELRIQVECGCLVMVCPRSKVSGLVPWAGMSQKHASTGGCYSDKSTTQMLTIPAGKWKGRLLSWVSLFANNCTKKSSIHPFIFLYWNTYPGLLHVKETFLLCLGHYIVF